MSTPWKVAVVAIAGVLIVLLAGGGYAVVRYRAYYLPAGSMEPTIKIGQTVVGDRFAYRNGPPSRGDVVIFMPPIQAKNPYFKRVVAVPGDRFAIHGGRAFVNGKRVDEPYAPWRAPYELAVREYDMWVDGERLDRGFATIPPRAQWTAPDTVPRGCYIVLGDNRPNSEDSHAFGFFCPGQRVPNAPAIHPELIGRAILPQR